MMGTLRAHARGVWLGGPLLLALVGAEPAWCAPEEEPPPSGEETLPPVTIDEPWPGEETRAPGAEEAPAPLEQAQPPAGEQAPPAPSEQAQPAPPPAPTHYAVSRMAPYEPLRAGHPLRIIAYALHPIGVILDYAIFRPAYWIGSHEPIKTLVGQSED